MSSLIVDTIEAGFSYHDDCAEDLTSVVANAGLEQADLPSGRNPDAGSQRPLPEFIGGNDVSVSTDPDRIKLNSDLDLDYHTTGHDETVSQEALGSESTGTKHIGTDIEREINTDEKDLECLNVKRC